VPEPASSRSAIAFRIIAARLSNPSRRHFLARIALTIEGDHFFVDLGY
jgi:hypothetical protein